MIRKSASALLFALAFGACQPDGPPPEYIPEKPAEKASTNIPYTLVKRYPHDINAFTEGFFFYNDQLFESTGSPDHLPRTRSTFGIIDTVTGDLRVKGELDHKIYFGEGMAAINNKLYWLTWQNQTGFIYDANTFRRLGQFNYANKEGWGLTVHGEHLVMSDGTYNLTYINPENFSVVKTLSVTKDGYGLDYINELEYINGYIYANVWMSHLIVKIDPANGKVVGQLDLTRLYNEARKINPRIAEMNGIAYDPGKDRVLVTGKLWPEMYEIKFAW